MNSWDCFDTLIARSFHSPKSIFDIVGKKIGDLSFTQKRIDAERLSKHKTYEDIYAHLPQYDSTLEIQTEKEYSFPILENWNRVKDGDIIISDMYLSSSQIRDLLDHHGFNKDIRIISTYGGKHSGRVWSSLKNSKINIENHYGDNLHSDIKMSRSFGFNSIFFGGNEFTQEERYLSDNNQYFLAALMRRARLSNPYFAPKSSFIHSAGSFQNIAGHDWIEEIHGQVYLYTLNKNFEDHFLLRNKKYKNTFVKLYFDGTSLVCHDAHTYTPLYKGIWTEDPLNYESPTQRLIWIDQSQFNLPILVLTALALPTDKNLVFSQRDCLYLRQIYNILLEKNSPMLEVCRRSYLKPFSQEYINYIISTTKNSTIVDSHGSGYSSNMFLQTYNHTCDVYHIFKHYLDMTQKKRLGFFEDFEIGHQMECTSLGGRTWFCPGRSFEKYNIHDTGRLIGWQSNAPVRNVPEHDKIIATTIEKAINNTCSFLHLYKDLLVVNNEILPTLAKKLKNTFTDIVVNTIGK
jgi:hypothetical protein